MTRDVTLRKQIFDVLDGPVGEHPWSRPVNVALGILIGLNVLAVTLETVPAIYAAYHPKFAAFENISLIIFTVEYLLRLWCSVETPPMGRSGWYRLHYMFTPMALVDLVAILPSILSMFFVFDLRFLRILRLLRVLKLTRYFSAMGILFDVLREEASAFLAAFSILFVLLVLSASGMYLAEHVAQPDKFRSVPESMWWAVATLTTVGYGDMTPITPHGRLFGGIITLIGMGMAALPAGILASGMADHLHRRRDSLRNEFRQALQNGKMDEMELHEIENLRKRLGLSRETANSIQENVLLKMAQSKQCTCPSCGTTFTIGGDKSE